MIKIDEDLKYLENAVNLAYPETKTQKITGFSRVEGETSWAQFIYGGKRTIIPTANGPRLILTGAQTYTARETNNGKVIVYRGNNPKNPSLN